MKLLRKIVALAATVTIAALGNFSVSAEVTMLPSKLNLTNIDYQRKDELKVSFDLISLQSEYKLHLQRANNLPFQPSNPLLQVYDGRVVIDAIASGKPDILLAELKELGLQKASAFGLFVSGLLPIEAIDKLTSLNSLKFVRPAYRPLTNIPR